MTVAIYLPLVMSVLLAGAGRYLARRLAPAPGAVGLTITAAVVALSSLWSVSLLVVSLIDDLPGGPPIPVPDWVSIVAGAVLVWSGARLAHAFRIRRRQSRAIAPMIADGQGELLVLPDVRPYAFAVAGSAGRPGRIVVTGAMLRVLSGPQRRAMLAHERAHLHRHHPLLLTVAQYAAAANPLLGPVAAAVGYLCERSADEAAAEDVGDRLVVAEALAAATIAETGWAEPAVAAFHRLGVVARVAALVTPPPPYRRIGLVTAIVIALVALTSACDATDQFYLLVSRAGLS